MLRYAHHNVKAKTIISTKTTLLKNTIMEASYSVLQKLFNSKRITKASLLHCNFLTDIVPDFLIKATFLPFLSKSIQRFYPLWIIAPPTIVHHTLKQEVRHSGLVSNTSTEVNELAQLIYTFEVWYGKSTAWVPGVYSHPPKSESTAWTCSQMIPKQFQINHPRYPPINLLYQSST